MDAGYATSRHREQVYRLSKEFKADHPEVPWSGVAGVRHRIVHDYEGSNWDLLAHIIFVDVPPFIDQVEHLITTAGAIRNN